MAINVFLIEEASSSSITEVAFSGTSVMIRPVGNIIQLSGSFKSGLVHPFESIVSDNFVV